MRIQKISTTSKPGRTKVSGLAGAVHIDIPALWRDVEGSDVGRLLVHLEAHGGHHLGFTFSAVDDDSEIADAVGSAFDYVLVNLAPGHG